MTAATSPAVSHPLMIAIMSGVPSEMYDKSSEIADEMARRVQIAALPVRPTDSIKARIVRASIRLGIQYQRCRALWYRAARRIEAHEADLIRARTAHLGALQREVEALYARRAAGMDADDGQLCLDLDGGGAAARAEPDRPMPPAQQQAKGSPAAGGR